MTCNQSCQRGETQERSKLVSTTGKVAETKSAIDSILGNSNVIDLLRKQILRVGPTSARVLILGEPGTGKELVARALHDASGARGEFTALNCAAVPSELIESELFGYAKGAFTGAVSGKQGMFEIASKGTLFLDEVGDMPLPMQAKLLRALETMTVRPVGARDSVKVDCRVICATNRDLKAEVKARRFREDLYHRIATFPLLTPSLRARLEDVPQLATAYLEKANPALQLLPDALSVLRSHTWPGNVRELINVCERIGLLVVNTLAVDGAVVRQAIDLDTYSERMAPTAAPPSFEVEALAVHVRELTASTREWAAASRSIAAASRTRVARVRAGMARACRPASYEAIVQTTAADQQIARELASFVADAPCETPTMVPTEGAGVRPSEVASALQTALPPSRIDLAQVTQEVDTSAILAAVTSEPPAAGPDVPEPLTDVSAIANDRTGEFLAIPGYDDSEEDMQVTRTIPPPARRPIIPGVRARRSMDGTEVEVVDVYEGVALVVDAFGAEDALSLSELEVAA